MRLVVLSWAPGVPMGSTEKLWVSLLQGDIEPAGPQAPACVPYISQGSFHFYLLHILNSKVTFPLENNNNKNKQTKRILWLKKVEKPLDQVTSTSPSSSSLERLRSNCFLLLFSKHLSSTF